MSSWRKTLDAVSLAIVLCMTAAGEASAQEAGQGAGPGEAVVRYRANGYLSERLHLMLRASQLIGTVVPKQAPLLFQKLLSAVWAGMTSPTMIVFEVPSVTEAIVTLPTPWIR